MWDVLVGAWVHGQEAYVHIYIYIYIYVCVCVCVCVLICQGGG